MNFYVIKIQNFCDRAKPWLGKVEALFHAIHPLLLGYEKRVCRNFDTPSFCIPERAENDTMRAVPQLFFCDTLSFCVCVRRFVAEEDAAQKKTRSCEVGSFGGGESGRVI